MVLTIRDPYSWLRSLINHIRTRPTPPDNPWHAFRDLRFGSHPFSHTSHTEPFRQAGLDPLDAYLNYWMHHNSRVAETVDSTRLCITATPDLERDIDRIARFLGVGDSEFLKRECHSNRGQHAANPLSDLSHGYLRERMDHYRSLLLARVKASRCATHVEMFSRETLFQPEY